MKLFVRDKSFYKTLLAIAIPIALQNLINVAVSMMDTLMIGQLGEVQLSATALANQLWFMMMIVCFGISGGANVLIAQYWGKRDVAIIRKVEAMTYKITLVIALFFSSIALFFPSQFMSILTTDEQVIAYGVQYLQIIAYSYPLYALASVSIMMLRAVGTVKISVVVYLSSLVVNTALNYVLIFGHFGAPRLEVRGGALATCFARVAEFVIAFFFILTKEKDIRFSLHDLKTNNRDLYKKYINISLPVIGNEAMWGIGASMVTVVIGRMGTNFVAANSIYSVLNQLVSVCIFGIGSAALTIVGNTIGAGEYELAKQRSTTLYIIGLGFGIASSLVTLLLSPLFVGMYDLSEETRAIALAINQVGALIVVFQALAVVSMVGILRAGGDARYVLICEVIFLWFVAVPLGFFTGLILHWPAPIVFLLLKSDEILKTLFTAVRLFRFRWLRDITVRD